MGKRAGKKGGVTTREKQLKQAQAKADWLQPFLKNEKGWDLATGARKPATKKEITLKRRAVTRLSKKAVALMYPNYGCSVRRGSGNSRHWVKVELVKPSPGSAAQKKKKLETDKVLCRKVEDTLLALKISFATYLPDALPGEDRHEPCLSITVSDKS